MAFVPAREFMAKWHVYIYIYIICVCIKSTRISMKNISVLYSKPYNKIYCIIYLFIYRERCICMYSAMDPPSYGRPLFCTQHTRNSMLQPNLCSFNKSRLIRVFMSATLLESYCHIQYRSFKKDVFSRATSSRRL